MDISKATVANTAPLHLKDAEGNPLYSGGDVNKPVRIILYSPGTPQFAAVEARQSQRALKRMQDNDGKATVATPEERRAHSAEDLAAVTAGFENLTYSPAGDATGIELYQAVYADPALGYIVNQANKFINDWGNFKRGSAAS